MVSVYGYYSNGVCVPTETLKLKDRQQVIITVVEAPKEDYPESFVSSLLASKAEIEAKRAAGTLKTFDTPEEMFEDLHR
jgi:hypothetical protein